MRNSWRTLFRLGCGLLCVVTLLWACSGPNNGNNNNNTNNNANGNNNAQGKVEPGGVLVVWPEKPDPALARLEESLKTYLTTLSGSAPQMAKLPAGDHSQVVEAAKEKRAGLVLVLQAQSTAQDLFAKGQPTSDPSSFAMVTKDEGDWSNRLASKGATFVYTTGDTRLARQYAIYEFLRRLGARFYHPEQEFVPANDPKQLRDRARTPTTVAHRKDGKASDIYSPDYAYRSYSFHGSHPLEHLEAFSDANHPIREAVNVNDWIVKNRGNLFKGAGRGVAKGDRRKKRVDELNKLRQTMGFPSSTGLPLHNQQQGASGLVDPNSPKPARQQIEEHVEKLVKNNPNAYEFGIHFGPTEFTVTPDKETVDWINWAGQKALSLNPKLRVVVNNHITGSQPMKNYDDLGCPNGTNTNNRIDYYDLAFHTDKRFAVKVHTVMFYPLEGPAFVYNQKTFSHKLCLMQKASEAGRPLVYFPEGSWWLSFDNPIPVYLPLYILARGRDIELIKPLLASRGKGTLYAHRMFNSGHEWGYWQQDYAVGLWHWNVDTTLEQVVGELMDPFCPPSQWKDGCNARKEAADVFLALMTHQQEYFLNRKDWKGLAGGLYAYFAGEDPADEIAAVTGFEFRPVKVSFRAVSRWDKSQIQTFRQTDLKAMETIIGLHEGWLQRMKAIEADIPQVGKPWFDEIVDGIEVNLLRARQTQQLYEAVIAYREAELENEAKKKKDPNAQLTPPKEAASAWWKKATETLAQAETLIRKREKAYRYPPAQTHGGGDTPETAVPNGTTYPWRVHTKTHTLAYWKNRHQQVQDLLDGKSSNSQSLRVSPVIAAPGESLTLEWPKIPGLQADVSIGSTKVKTTDTSVDLGKDDGYWPITGSLQIGGREVTLSGGVARSTKTARTPPKGMKLKQPDSPIAQNVLTTLFPAILWAEVSKPEAGLALATDLDNDKKARFGDVLYARFTSTSTADAFTTEPIAFRMPVPDPATGDLALTIGVTDMVLSGKRESNGALASPITMKGNLELKDLADALIKLAGFDEKGAYQTLASVLKFNPDKPPASVPFEADLKLEAP